MSLPVVIIGAGPIGLAAAVRLHLADVPFLILEAETEAAAAVEAWGHVQMFSPWSWNLDPAGVELLSVQGWTPPDPEVMPTGRELVETYLRPLARSPALSPHLRTGSRATGIERLSPGVLGVRLANGEHILARAVIDASGVWSRPNGLGPEGSQIEGETLQDGRIRHGPTDVLGRYRTDYAGRRTLVAGAGHSGMHAVLDLLSLRREAGAGDVLWAAKGPIKLACLGLAEETRFPGRAALHRRAAAEVQAAGAVVLEHFEAGWIAPSEDRLMLHGHVVDQDRTIEVDRLIVTTGFRPDLSLFDSLAAAINPSLQCPSGLAPVLRGLTSCGSQPLLRPAQLEIDGGDVFVIGIKSFGLSRNFDLQIGYHQADIVAEAVRSMG